MARAIREYQIRPMVCDWALDIPMGNTTFVLHFNSRNNAELVKAILEWEDSHSNEAIPYQPTLNVAEVMHGRWIPEICESISKRNRLIEYKVYSCSLCGRSNGRVKKKYCPNCGALMKEADHEVSE